MRFSPALVLVAAAALALATTGAASPASVVRGAAPATKHAPKQKAKKRAVRKQAAPVLTRRAAAASANLFANGSFETSLTGWQGYKATLSRVSGGADGLSAARVTGSSTDFSIYPTSRPVTTTVAGQAYTVEASVRTVSVPRKVCLRVREYAGTTLVASSEQCATSSATWQRLPDITYTARASGHSLDAYVYAWAAAPGDSFDVDALAFRPAATPTPTPTPTPAPGTASATGTDNAHIALAWPAVTGAASYRVLRGAIAVGSTAHTTFTDALLWPQTTYAYGIEALDAAGARLSVMSVTGTTQPLPPSGFPRPFAATSFWNTPIAAGAALSSRTVGIAQYLAAHATKATLTVGEWSVPVAESHPDDRAYTVPCTMYACTLGAFGAFRIPLTAQADPSSDGHLAVYDPVANREWDFWQGRASGTGWTASAGAAVSMSGSGVAPAGTGAGDAANFPLLGGLVRPEEIAQGHIDHALVFGIQGVGAGAPVCPATHNAPTSTDPNAPREGTHVQLDPAIDVSSLPIPAYAKIVARALQTYGMYLRDSAGSLGVYGENPIGRGYDPWPSALGIAPGNSYPSLAGIPWSRFRVLAAPDYPSC